MRILEGVIICPDEYKKYFLEEELKSNSFFNRTYYTLDSLIDELFEFSDKKALIDTKQFFSTSVETASIYLEQIKYTCLLKENTQKLSPVFKLRNFLLSKGYTLSNSYFKKILEQNNVSFIGYPLTKELSLIIEYINEFTSAKYIEDTLNLFEIKEINEFSKIKDEITFVFTKISKLLDSGVKPSKIKIVNLNSDYYFYSNILINEYKLPISYLDNTNLATTSTAKLFLEKCLISNSFSEIIDSFPDTENFVLDKIIEIINQYKLVDNNPKDFALYLSYELSKKSFPNINYEDEIKIINLENLKSSDECYYFVMSFDNDNSYKIYKDNDFLSDTEKIKLGLDTSSELTNISRLNTAKKLRSIKNLVLTYKLKSPFKSFSKSNLVDELNLIVKTPFTPILYNSTVDSLILSESLNNYLKYNEKDFYLEKLYYKDFPFMSYDNSFTPLNNDIYNKFKDKRLRLSYSSINKYFNCPFKYYAANVLKIDEFKSSLATELGNFAHKILEDSINDGFDIEKIQIENVSPLESIYYEKVLKHVKDIYYFNKKMEKRTTFNHVITESDISIKFDDLNMDFIGKIDKVLYNDLNEAMIIDYKTGSTPFALDNFNYGLSAQLPIYYYMLKKSGKIPSPRIVGLYLQYINLKNFNFDPKISIEEQEEKSMLLNGYTSTSSFAATALSANANDDLGEYAYCAGVKLKKDGNFTSSSKVCDEADFTRMYNITDSLIRKSTEAINNGEFPIFPKEIENKLVGCKYCKFSDVCFIKFKDRNRLKKDPFFKNKKDNKKEDE